MRPTPLSSMRCADSTRRLLPLAMVVALLLLPAAVVRADIGRKPTMEFTFEYQIDPVSIVEGQLIECEDENCATGEPLEQVGPQDFTCDQDSCSSMAYGYADYHKLVITFTDRVRESNVFTHQGVESSFKVIVLESELVIEQIQRGVGGLGCCSGLGATIAIEVLVAMAYLTVLRLPRTALGWVGLSSVFTLPVVWFVFPNLRLPSGWSTGLAEGFAVLFEAGLIYVATRRTMSLKHAAALSLVMNGVSFLVGLLLAL
jgi:hypothetical protein